MAYSVHFAFPSKKEIRKLDQGAQKTILSACQSLGKDPHPPGHTTVKTQKGLWRIRVRGKYRVIYAVYDRLEAVIIVTVRLKGKGAYNEIPVTDLSAKVAELEKVLEG